MALTDAELLEAWRGGDKTAGSALFAQHFEAIHRFFVNKVDRDVEDLVQRTFVACVEARDRFAGRSSFRTFLFGIANNILRERYRGRRKEAVDFNRDSVADLGAGPSTVLAEKREERVLLEALRRIPLDLQVVLELYYWERLTGPQLGEVLAIPENTARSRVRRGKELVAAEIAKLDATREILESTAANLDQWAGSVRARLDQAVP